MEKEVREESLEQNVNDVPLLNQKSFVPNRNLLDNKRTSLAKAQIDMQEILKNQKSGVGAPLRDPEIPSSNSQSNANFD
jgi:hypothetical protein